MKPEYKFAYLGLGSNLGDRIKNLGKAISQLSHHPLIKITSSSSFYETEPVGYRNQGWFINQAIRIETTLCPIELLETIKGIERQLGREKGVKWGPRTIDIDILFYEDTILDTPHLTIPHPLIHERMFVLATLAEIAQSFIHPILDKTIREILIDITDKNLVKKYKCKERSSQCPG